MPDQPKSRMLSGKVIAVSRAEKRSIAVCDFDTWEAMPGEPVNRIIGSDDTE